MPPPEDASNEDKKPSAPPALLLKALPPHDGAPKKRQKLSKEARRQRRRKEEKNPNFMDWYNKKKERQRKQYYEFSRTRKLAALFEEMKHAAAKGEGESYNVHLNSVKRCVQDMIKDKMFIPPAPDMATSDALEPEDAPSDAMAYAPPVPDKATSDALVPSTLSDSLVCPVDEPVDLCDSNDSIINLCDSDDEISNESIEMGIITWTSDLGSFAQNKDQALKTLLETPRREVRQFIRGDDNDILVKIGLGEKGRAIELKRRSMKTLRKGKWLDDDIINSYIVCLQRRDMDMCDGDSERKPSYFFNTHFYSKLTNPEFTYNDIKKWGEKCNGSNIFDLKYLVVPINIGNRHWTCAIVFMEKRKIVYYDSLPTGDQDELMKPILEYLSYECQDKLGRDFDASQWTLESGNTPQQKNNCDCGVFVCMIIDFITRELPLCFTQRHISHCRDRIAHCIVRGCYSC